MVDPPRPFSDRSHDLQLVEALYLPGIFTSGGGCAGNADNRGPVVVGGGQAGQGICDPWAGGHQANTHLSGGQGPSLGCVGGGRFVPDVDPPNTGFLSCPPGWVDVAPAQGKQVAHARVLQAADHQLSAVESLHVQVGLSATERNWSSRLLTAATRSSAGDWSLSRARWWTSSASSPNTWATTSTAGPPRARSATATVLP